MMRAGPSKHETNDLIRRLEERRYGRTFNSMELAQKASVPLDDINRAERQLPIADTQAVERVAKTRGVTAHWVLKIAGLEEISTEELQRLADCLDESGDVSPKCQRVGIQRLAT